jgi:hypothetical protein
MRGTTPRTLRLATIVAGLVAAACGDGYGGGSAAPPQRAFVTFRYEAAVAVDADVAAAAPACVSGVGHTHIHPSWRSFERVDMTADGSGWTISFDDVPVDSRERIRVSDPNACAENPTGAATRNVFANGVRLTDVVDTPGSGTEPGLAFTVAAYGSVMP